VFEGIVVSLVLDNPTAQLFEQVCNLKAYLQSRLHSLWTLAIDPS